MSPVRSIDELIYNRRSIRSFQPTLPPETWLRDLILCAAQAPSPSNSQPVRFIRIASEDKKELIGNAIKNAHEHLLLNIQMQELSKKLKNKVNAYYRFATFMCQAPWLFAVGTDTEARMDFNQSLIDAGLPGNSSMHTDDISVGLSIQSFLLKATDLGLGCCILTAPLIFVPSLGKMKDFDTIHLKCFIAAGFPDETPVSPPKKNFEEIYREV